MREVGNSNYEVTFILGESAAAEEAKAKTKELTALIEKFGGKVEKDEQWGKRELAYTINKNRSGYYVTMWFSLPNNQVSAFERALRFDESIIRSLVTKAYTTAQPGSLYPMQEEEKPVAKGRKAATTEAVSAEEELRRGTPSSKKEKAVVVDEDITPDEAEELSEEDRLKKLDEAMDELLKEVASDSPEKADS